MMTDRLTAELAAIATKHGAAGFGVTGVEPFERERKTLRAGKLSGLSGPLRFTYDDPDLATDVLVSFPWARHLVVVGWSYLGSSARPAQEGAVVGRFATSDHYEGVRRLTSRLADRLRGNGHRAEVLSDDNRLVDRAAAVRSGVGWSGKSTMTLAPGHGPWMLLGTIVTDARLTVSEPMRRGCGTCVACFPACPTNALSERGLDARRCLSTWLQTPGSLPHWIRPLLGRRIYGCDDCLTACPPGSRALVAADEKALSLPFDELLALNDDALLERFHWWYVPRREGRYLRRNLLIAAGNSGEPEAQGSIEDHMTHPSSMIRSHACWAFARSRGAASVPALRAALDSETAPETRDEMALCLLMVEHPEKHRRVLAADEWARGIGTVRGLALVVGDGSEEPGVGPGLVAVDDSEPWSLMHPPDWLEVVYSPARALLELAPGLEAMVRVYDPDRILDRLRSTIRRVGSDQA